MQTVLKPVKWIFRQIPKYTSIKKGHFGLFYKLNNAISKLTSENKRNEEIITRSLKQFEDKNAPVNAKILEVSSPQRVTVFLSEINFKYFSGQLNFVLCRQ